MLAEVGKDGRRWASLIDALPDLPPREYESVVQALDQSSAPKLELKSPDSAIVWCALRQLVSQHRSFADADWVCSLVDQVDKLAEMYERFEPAALVPRFAWLFAQAPDLLAGRESADGTYWQHVGEARREAVDAVMDTGGLTALLELARAVESPARLGAVLGSGEYAAVDKAAFSVDIWPLTMGSSPSSLEASSTGALKAKDRNGLSPSSPDSNWY